MGKPITFVGMSADSSRVQAGNRTVFIAIKKMIQFFKIDSLFKKDGSARISLIYISTELRFLQTHIKV